MQYRDQDATTPASPGGHEGPPLGGPGFPGGKGRVIGLVLGAVVVVSLVTVALAAGGGHHRPIAAPVVPTSKPRSATPTTAAHAVRTTTAPATSTAVPSSVTPTASPISPPIAAPPTVAPSVTAGTAVPWSPASSNTLVGDNGNPKDWPAAQPKPPSLAGAHSDNMIKVIVTLVTYQDWVYAHPSPALVKNYMAPGTSTYSQELAFVQTWTTSGWHSSGAPSEIDWVAVTQQPKQVTIDGHKVFMPATVTIVFNRKAAAIDNDAGRVVAREVALGRLAYSTTLGREASGQWRIVDTTQLHPVGGLGSLAK